MEHATEQATARTQQSSLRLLKQAAGGPREIAGKLGRLGDALRAYVRRGDIDARLQRLADIGYLQRAPTRLQLIVGAADMLRFWITPAAAEYYESKGIDFTFHQVLRVLDEPASMVDPTGLLSTRDNIIGHLMQVVHANPAYDLQLLQAHENGLLELERQLEQMIEGSHPRARSINAVVEEAGYHERLLGYVREFRRDPDAEAPLRDNIAQDERWREIEQTFGTLPAALRYFAELPDTVPGAIRHLRTVQQFPVELARRAGTC